MQAHTNDGGERLNISSIFYERDLLEYCIFASMESVPYGNDFFRVDGKFVKVFQGMTKRLVSLLERDKKGPPSPYCPMPYFLIGPGPIRDNLKSEQSFN